MRRHRHGLLPTHNQRGDAKRSIDATPAMFGEIDDNEDITGKEGVQSVPQLARVPNSPPQSRKKTSEAQPMEIELRPVLLMSEHSRDEPTLPWPQFQTAEQPFAPQSSPRAASSLTRAGFSLGKLRPFGRSDAPTTKYFE